jgi:LuxR family maltose regulon positive regulatory protein
MKQARQAYDVLPRSSGYASAMASGYFGIGLQFDGQADAAIALLESVCREAPRSTDLECVVGSWALAWIGTMAARPRDVVRWAGQLVRADATGATLSAAWGHGLQGLAYYELNRLSEARAALLAADRLRPEAHRLSARNTLLGLAMIEQAAGDLAAASDTLQALREMPDIADSPRHVAAVKVFEARLAYAWGDLAAVREILAGIGGEPMPATIESISGSPSLTYARLYIALGTTDDLAEAARRLDALEAAAASVNDTLQLIGVQAVRALLCQARGDAGGALRFLEQAVVAAAPNGLVRTFVDLGAPMQRLIAELERRGTPSQPYLAHLLAAFSAADNRPQQPIQLLPGPRLGSDLIEPLTWRETEVLRLLDARLSNQEIAGVLVISAETVKKHTSNIYQKLQVTGRREAVARSYALGILPAATPAPMPLPLTTPEPVPDHRQA